MISISDKQNCCGCKACYNACPKHCIKMVLDTEGFWYPNVDRDKCIDCGLCEKVCPEINIYKNSNSNDRVECLAAWNNDKEVRRKSSSGGIFTSIAECILSNGGIVFGAGYDDNLKVIHKEANTIQELNNLRGSKYVQSDIKEVYKKAKQYLNNGKKVLFTGTPCQIAGLYNFLQKEYNELYTCDLVCHGVPSPKVFEEYKKYMERKHNSSIENIDFRHKRYGWKLYSVSLLFNNGTEYIKNLSEDVYMQGFLRNYYLRPSCYKCTYAKLPRVSDITLADFWGISYKYPELDDDKGTSLLLINTNKGKKIIDSCGDNIFKQVCDLEYAILNNPCIIKSGKAPKLRKSFFKDFNTKDFDYVIKKYMGQPSWIKRKLIFIKRDLAFIKRRILRLMK
ncbi:Coenzyme F420 hydrogenase/dehydrogenase, beta subunit C-terminal domain [Clostridium sp. JN-1]|uniref:Coenzyme F420 hydrogenase/dehydrogenase, beta subunit C-terminal domain n=1 Tax=Clostridium sp. JN-1 TaxID=2483110 RepID=UPI000F0B85AD|nr:Coenzyme F420 hydrogenase/dehydrogenase, beta subunit C-terminal domain [Clostridium sp. JN-1]